MRIKHRETLSRARGEARSPHRASFATAQHSVSCSSETLCTCKVTRRFLSVLFCHQDDMLLEAGNKSPASKCVPKAQ